MADKYTLDGRDIYEGHRHAVQIMPGRDSGERILVPILAERIVRLLNAAEHLSADEAVELLSRPYPIKPLPMSKITAD